VVKRESVEGYASRNDNLEMLSWESPEHLADEPLLAAEIRASIHR
jgi:hypothetical protein